MDAAERLAQAEAQVERAERHRRKVFVIKTAEQEIPSLWDTGQVTMAALAKQYAISPMTVRRILLGSGRELKRFRKLTHEERAEVLSLIAAGRELEHLAEIYRVSKATIRRLGVEAGLIKKGQRKPRRSDEEYANIEAFDREARARFNGAGLYNLGLGLRAWQMKRRNEARMITEAQNGSGPEDTAWQLNTPIIVDGDHANDPLPRPAPAPAPQAPPAAPVVIGDGQGEDTPAVVGPNAPKQNPFSY